MKEYEIWIEGYSATGESGIANFIGKASGNTFVEACNNFEYPEDIKAQYRDEIIVRKGEKLKLDGMSINNYVENAPVPKIWGCLLFDNETDARKSFG